jgi:serine/threonine-protein kinase
MSLATGTRLGPYEILSPLGVGGMGEVYRARDTKLGRDIAIKILPPASVLDPERVARFQREARTLATLNHPHIGAIYGFEDSGATHALVLELVEGDTLADRIARGPIPLDEALAIARQICEALEAAHERGIIHRDLKPANIKITPEGVVKVLDFGLAKLAHPDAVPGPADAMASPTITSPALMTGVGVLLGTAAYMSPEQAKGREADKRSDIWAFGVVLYEMLTGKRPFDGEDITEVLGAVVRLEPNWDALSTDVPPPIRTLLQSCLIKDRAHRVSDISTALFILDRAESLAAPVGMASVLSRPALWRRVIAPVTVALLTSTLVGAAVWFGTRPADPVRPRVSRLVIAPSGTAALTVNGDDLAITPDGSRVVYVGNRGTQLFVRALDALEPVVVFTGQPRRPFVSPDGQWIGFVDALVVLKKVAMTGGPAVTLATLDTVPRGAMWGGDDTIIVATNAVDTGLQKVSVGEPTTVLTRPDRAQGEADHLWPEPLPGGRAVLFTVTAVIGGLDAAQVAALDLQTGTRTVLLRGGTHARYVSSGLASPARAESAGGHLVYAAAGVLWAVPFDLTRLETRGTPVPVVPEVVTTTLGGADAVVAGNGTLAYVSGGTAQELTPRTLVWVDRRGRETPIPAPPLVYQYPRLSPDGTHIAVSAIGRGGSEGDIWVGNLAHTTFTRATFDPGYDGSPTWTPDGSRMIFTSERGGARNLFSQAANGPGTPERLTESSNRQNATAVSPDGRMVIFTEITPTTRDDVMAMTLDGSRHVTPLVQSPAVERNGIVSSDGRWLAYQADESGRFEIWVRPYPDVNTGRWQVSTAGGTRPLWARNGQELFYVSPAGALMRVGVGRGPSWAGTAPTLLVKEGYYTMDPGRTYDIARDGQRLLMIKEGIAEQTATPASLIVVQHWVEELKRLVPTH